MKKKLLIMAAGTILAAGLLAGCGSNDNAVDPSPTLGGDDYDRMDFNATDGGLSATDEAVAFGDESLKALLLAEELEEVADPLAEDPLVLEMEERSRRLEMYPADERPRFTYLRLRWGMLRGPEDSVRVEPPCDMTDWTGSIRVDNGVVVVKRQLRFEWPADHVVFPRLDRQTVAFVSRTWCHEDGLLLQIIEPPQDETDTPEAPNKLHIDMPLFQGEFLVSELADLDDLIEVDDKGNRIKLQGFGLEDIEVCPKGWLSGRYRHLRQDRPDSLDGEDRGERHGSYAGAWFSLTGRIGGFMRGGYGTNAEGERVLIGKLIDRRGRFVGLVRGDWEPAAEDGGLAEFRARWVAREGEAEGVLAGRAHPVPGYPGGFYEGRWTTRCDQEAESLIQ